MLFTELVTDDGTVRFRADRVEAVVTDHRKVIITMFSGKELTLTFDDAGVAESRASAIREAASGPARKKAADKAVG